MKYLVYYKALTDQSDFLVVGVLGCQGVGKSTILSLLANGLALKDKRLYIKYQKLNIFCFSMSQNSRILVSMYIHFTWK